MTRLGITAAEVELAAENLLQKGQNPTIEKIRQLLGTGSNSTIGKYLNDWKNHRLRASAEVLPSLQAPSDPVNEAVKKVWQQLQADNAAKMDELMRATDLRVQTIQIEKQEIEQLLTHTVTENDSLRSLLRDERAKTDDLAQEVITLKRDLVVYQEKAALFEQRILHAETAHPAQLQSLLENNQEAAQNHKQQLTAQREDYEQAIATLKEHMEKFRHQQILLIDGLRTELSKTTEQLRKSKETIAELQVQKAQATQHAQDLLEINKERATILQNLSVLHENIAQLSADQSKFQDNLVHDVIDVMDIIPSRLSYLEAQLQGLSTQWTKKAVKPKKVKA